MLGIDIISKFCIRNIFSQISSISLFFTVCVVCGKTRKKHAFYFQILAVLRKFAVGLEFLRKNMIVGLWDVKLVFEIFPRKKCRFSKVMIFPQILELEIGRILLSKWI